MMSRFLFVGSSNYGVTELRLALNPSSPSVLGMAFSHEEAHRLLSSGHYSLVFLEDSLVNAEFIQTLRESNAALPVIALISSEENCAGEAMLASGAVDYLCPSQIETAQVARAVRYALTQKQLWQSLRASDERHKVIMQTSGQGWWRLEYVPPIPLNLPLEEQVDRMIQQARIVECNEANARMHGFADPSAIQGQWIRDFVRDAEAEAAIVDFLSKFVRSGYRLRETEFMELDIDANAKYFLTNFTGLIEDGHLVGSWGAQTDVTALKHGETIQTRLNSIIESARDQIFTVSLDGILQSWNHGAEEILGFSAQEVIGKSIALVIPPEGLPLARDIVARIGRGEQVPNYEAKRLHKDGTLREISMSVSPYYNSQGDIIGMWGVGRDITQAKIADEELRRSEKLYHTLASNFPNGSVYLLDLDKRFLLVEGKGLGAVGLSREDAIGKTVLEVFGETTLGHHLNEIYDTALDGETVTREVEVNGHHRLLHILPVRDEQGNVIHILAMTQDVTEQRKAREALEHSQKLYQALANNVPNGSVLLLDRDLRFVLVEGQKLPPVGMTKQEMVGKHLDEVFGNSPGNEEALRLYRNALEGESGSTEVAINGSYRWVHIAPVWENGEITGVMAMSQDVTPLKKAETELRISQERLEVAVNSGRIALWEWNALTNEHHSTSYYKKQLGYAEDDDYFESLRDAFTETLHPDDRARVAEKSMALQHSTDTTFQDEFRLRHKDGRYRWILSQGTVFRDENGKLERLLGSHIDITNLKASEEEIFRSREALQDVNDELERRVEERTNELAKTNEALRLESNERVGALSALEEAVTLLEQARDESERANTELRANEARLLYGNLVFTELTKLRVADQSELREALAAVTQAGTNVLDLERCSVWMFNEDQSVLRCTDLYERGSRQHSQDMELVVDDYPNYFRALQTRESIVADDAHTHPATREFSKGYLTPLGINAMLDAPIVINGHMVGVLCCEQVGEARLWKVEDHISTRSLAGICSLTLESLERARVEDDLRQAKNDAESAREEAERANQAKSEFLSRMSHELRTPMNSILGFAQILEMTLTEEKQAQRIKLILKAGRHLLHLINEVLDVARVESGHLTLAPEPILAETVVTSTADMVRPLYQQLNLQFELDLSCCSDTYVLADQQRLSQVLLNLLSNAGKYNRQGGKVTVNGQILDGKMLRLNVIDTGHGISPKFLSKVFQPFERLGREGGAIEGTGLGLALSKHLVEAMGGRLGIASEEGVGSTFWVDIPTAESPVRPGEEAPQEPEAPVESEFELAPVTKSHTILYIEDNAVNLKVLEHLLKNEPNINLISAMQGQLGLDLARQHRPSLILLDLHLPDMDGDEVLRRLLTDATLHNIPVVMLSADATPSQIAYLLAVGASEYLTKPLNLKILLSVIRKFLNET
ncbi:PAS domain S-box protein [bacterium]|nr:MAG: PAS domain S-box protein [bacterium]